MAFPVSDAEHAAIKARIAALPELIVAAAVRVTADHLTLPVILFSERPGRHGNVIWAAGSLSGDKSKGGEHGFVTTHGRFVDREEAARIVLAMGQGSPRDFGPEYPLQLFSEDMWNDWDVTPSSRVYSADVFGAATEDGSQPSQPVHGEARPAASETTTCERPNQ